MDMTKIQENDDYRLVSSVCMSLDSFKKLVEEISDGNLTAVFDDEVAVYLTRKAEMTAYDDSNVDVLAMLSKYFNEDVSSYHGDGNICCPMVFIIFSNNDFANNKGDNTDIKLTNEEIRLISEEYDKSCAMEDIADSCNERGIYLSPEEKEKVYQIYKKSLSNDDTWRYLLNNAIDSVIEEALSSIK